VKGKRVRQTVSEVTEELKKGGSTRVKKGLVVQNVDRTGARPPGITKWGKNAIPRLGKGGHEVNRGGTAEVS